MTNLTVLPDLPGILWMPRLKFDKDKYSEDTYDGESLFMYRGVVARMLYLPGFSETDGMDALEDDLVGLTPADN